MPISLPHRLLALDIARITGFAYGPLAAVVPVTGHWKLPLEDPRDRLGARIATLEDVLRLFLRDQRIDTVVIAERFPPRAIGQMASGFGLDGVVRAECWRSGARLLWQPENQIRREVYGRSGRSEDMKSEALTWCRRQGICAVDDNAAEAAVLWRWSRDEFVRQRGALRGGAAAFTAA